MTALLESTGPNLLNDRLFQECWTALDGAGATYDCLLTCAHRHQCIPEQRRLPERLDKALRRKEQVNVSQLKLEQDLFLRQLHNFLETSLSKNNTSEKLFDDLQTIKKNIEKLGGLQDGRLIPRDVQIDPKSPSQMSLFDD